MRKRDEQVAIGPRIWASWMLVALTLVTIGVGNGCDDAAAGSPALSARRGPVTFTTDGPLHAKRATLTLYERSHAVVIGIDRYGDMPRLKGAVRDAEAMARELTSRGFTVHRLLDGEATRARIASLLGDVLSKKTRRDDRVLVYFAGHGVTSGAGPGRVGYLMPVDGDAKRPAATGVPMTELTRWFAGYEAKHVLFLADACYAGLALSTRAVGLRPAIERYLQAISSRRIRVVVTAGGEQEQANEFRGHGLFTHFLLRALAGAADGNGDGVITSDELVAYIKPEVGRTAHVHWGVEQNPQSARSGEGEFVFLSPLGRTRKVESCRSSAGRRHASSTRGAVDPGRFVRIGPGLARVGTEPGAARRDADEERTDVPIQDAFMLQTTEVTQQQWRRAMGSSPSTFAGCGGDCPVEEVTFWDALAYCNALSKAERRPACYELKGCDRVVAGGMRCASARLVDATCTGYRLPTDAQWEYAARAGTRAETHNGDLAPTARRTSEVLDAIAWHGGHNAADYAGAMDCSQWQGRRKGAAAGCGTQPVGGLKANAWGLYDVIGNVWEWVWSGDVEAGSSPGKRGVVTADQRIARGGGWYNDVRDCRSANRFVLSGDAHFFNVGFRVARTVPSDQAGGSQEANSRAGSDPK